MVKKMRKKLKMGVNYSVDDSGKVLVAHYTQMAVAQTFLSAVSQVFQPARRGDNSSVRFGNKTLPTRMSAIRQTGMSAPHSQVFQPARRGDNSIVRFGNKTLPTRMSAKRQTGLSALHSQVFQPARRGDNSSVRFDTKTLPTRMSAKRQTGMSAPHFRPFSTRINRG